MQSVFVLVQFKPGDQVFAFTTGSTAANPNGMSRTQNRAEPPISVSIGSVLGDTEGDWSADRMTLASGLSIYRACCAPDKARESLLHNMDDLASVQTLSKSTMYVCLKHRSLTCLCNLEVLSLMTRVQNMTKQASFVSGVGSWAEFTVVPEELLVRSPNTLSLEREAGAVPLVSVTAFQALNSANIKPGDRVLVHAGSGGVGHIAVQLAKQYWGAYIVSTSRQVDFVKVSSW